MYWLHYSCCIVVVALCLLCELLTNILFLCKIFCSHTCVALIILFQWKTFVIICFSASNSTPLSPHSFLQEKPERKYSVTLIWSSIFHILWPPDQASWTETVRSRQFLTLLWAAQKFGDGRAGCSFRTRRRWRIQRCFLGSGWLGWLQQTLIRVMGGHGSVRMTYCSGKTRKELRYIDEVLSNCFYKSW